MEKLSHLYYIMTLSGAPAYIFEGVEENSDLVFVPEFTIQPKGLLRKILKFLLVGRIPISGRMLEWITGYKGYDWLTTLKTGDRLLLSGVTNLNTLRAISWITNPEVTRYQYFNNCLQFIYPKHIVSCKTRQMQAMGYRLVTFDPQEAEEYEMDYAVQFYRYPQVNDGEEYKYDFFFCGERKDRGQRLSELEVALKLMGFRCLFIVVDNQQSKPITYRQYLEYLKQSRCIVDLYQKGQTGITRRVLEALFFGKKLLTENPFIASFDFYREENIFVLDSGDVAGVRRFMELPLVSVPKEIMDKYEVNRWLDHFR